MEKKFRYRGKYKRNVGRPKKDYSPLDNELRKSIEDYYTNQMPMIHNYCRCYSEMFKNVTKDDVLSYFDELLVCYVAGKRKNIDKFGYFELTKSIMRTILNDLSHRKWYTAYTFDGESSEYDEDGCPYTIFDKKYSEINFVEHIMEDEHNAYIINMMKKCLNAAEKKYIEYYFTDECRQNTAEVARKFGCTRQNCSFIINKAIKKLGNEIKKIMF